MTTENSYQSTIPLIDCGFRQYETSVQGFQSFNVNFNFTFPKPPIVIATMVDDLTGGKEVIRSEAVQNITTTGFSFRFSDASTTSGMNGLNWIAILK